MDKLENMNRPPHHTDLQAEIERDIIARDTEDAAARLALHNAWLDRVAHQRAANIELERRNRRIDRRANRFVVSAWDRIKGAALVLAGKADWERN